MTTKNNTKQTITEAYVYWDNQDPMDTGWAYRSCWTVWSRAAPWIAVTGTLTESRLIN